MASDRKWNVYTRLVILLAILLLGYLLSQSFMVTYPLPPGELRRLSVELIGRPIDDAKSRLGDQASDMRVHEDSLVLEFTARPGVSRFLFIPPRLYLTLQFNENGIITHYELSDG